MRWLCRLPDMIILLISNRSNFDTESFFWKAPDNTSHYLFFSGQILSASIVFCCHGYRLHCVYLSISNSIHDVSCLITDLVSTLELIKHYKFFRKHSIPWNLRWYRNWSSSICYLKLVFDGICIIQGFNYATREIIGQYYAFSLGFLWSYSHWAYIEQIFKRCWYGWQCNTYCSSTVPRLVVQCFGCCIYHIFRNTIISCSFISACSALFYNSGMTFVNFQLPSHLGMVVFLY